MPLPRRHFLTLTAAALALPAQAEAPPVIAAAASLRFVMPALTAGFTTAGGGPVRVAFGSSGTLAQQIRNGAPFELFLSADAAYVQVLADSGAVQAAATVYARGRLALIAPHGGLAVDAAMDGLAAALTRGEIRRFAIATPEHAPYGQRAREALLHRGLWEAIAPHLVFGENVAQAAQFASSGNAQGGLVAASLAAADTLRARAESALIPDAWHSPLDQSMVLTPKAGATARAFHEFMQTPAAQEILAAYGFAAPEPA
ncbi:MULTISPECIES: molybdate ABC transporter substrate-binding protein [Marinovum]|uniref:molybdate ABC transporter substrate-binding protein n=1 Tax=Marinovum TaxID=367771 RepID=UPI00237AC664|nr:molybdate ABC transporter substrate-binding protein [Marinovum sp. PR37]MDD9744612.1 molybdate ABC transporter substrate-binding protein [Marinovum sp. PR37]